MAAATKYAFEAALTSAVGKCVGASVMPFAVCAKTNSVFMLLGREKFFKSYKCDSEKWSDFGGRALPTETSAERVAAREFIEESCGAVKIGEEATTTIDLVEASLRDENFVYRFDFELPGGCGVYTTFLKQIPLQPDVPETFQKNRALQANSDYLEKTELRWFGLQEIRNACFSSPTLRISSFEREYVRRWFRSRMRLILPHLTI